MKIIFFINTLSGGGAERVTTNLANVLAAKKYDVKIITFVEPSEDEYVLDARVLALKKCYKYSMLYVSRLTT